jgi:hypothetical protein
VLCQGPGGQYRYAFHFACGTHRPTAHGSDSREEAVTAIPLWDELRIWDPGD